MGKKTLAAREACVRPRLRVMRGKEIALGPGRVELLELIGETGSLRAAAIRMGVSYMRAWNLVKYSNKCFALPLVEANRGGKTGGGATLTEAGKQVVEMYRAMEMDSQKASAPTWKKLRKFLKA
jgi:molybdate transport system regulatory protein